MTNAVKGEDELVLADGRKFTLVMDFEAFVAAESLYSKPLVTIAVEAATGFMGATRALLYGALRAHHASVTPEEAGAMCLAEYDRVKAALEAADKASYPEPSEDKKPGKADLPRRGSSSGNSGAKRASNPTPSGGRRRAPSA